jgi:hypothetical protein
MSLFEECIRSMNRTLLGLYSNTLAVRYENMICNFLHSCEAICVVLPAAKMNSVPRKRNAFVLSVELRLLAVHCVFETRAYHY